MGLQHSIKQNGRIFIDFHALSIEQVTFKHLLATNELIFYINMSLTKKQEDFYCFKYDLDAEDNEFIQTFALLNPHIVDIVPSNRPYTDMFLLRDEHSLQIYKSNLAQSAFELEDIFEDKTNYHQLKWTMNDEGLIGTTYKGTIKYFDIPSRKIIQLYDESSENYSHNKTNSKSNPNGYQGFYHMELIDFDLFRKTLTFASMSGGVCLYDYDNGKKISEFAPNIHADNLSFNPTNYLLCFNERNTGRTYLYDLRKTNKEVGKFSLKDGIIIQQGWSRHDL